jgi:hypothetical protein
MLRRGVALMRCGRAFDLLCQQPPSALLRRQHSFDCIISII